VSIPARVTAPIEGRALMEALDGVAPTSPTACEGWTAHDIAAHAAAGAKEVADLIDEHLAARPPRPTRGFAEREAPFAALDDDVLRGALLEESRRKMAAIKALSELENDDAIQFTGRSFSAGTLLTHSRSEAALHRWDLVGEDDVSHELLAQSELTRHAVDVLNTLPILYEAPGSRAGHAGLSAPLRIVLRSPGERDIVLAHSETGGTGGTGTRFEIVGDGPAIGDAIVTTDAGNRLLTLWGRRSSERPLDFEADPEVADKVVSVLWPSAVRWPRSR
jgi:hypothetical protein